MRAPSLFTIGSLPEKIIKPSQFRTATLLAETAYLDRWASRLRFLHSNIDTPGGMTPKVHEPACLTHSGYRLTPTEAIRPAPPVPFGPTPRLCAVAAWTARCGATNPIFKPAETHRLAIPGRQFIKRMPAPALAARRLNTLNQARPESRSFRTPPRSKR
jgi:hypothetical protein